MSELFAPLLALFIFVALPIILFCVLRRTQKKEKRIQPPPIIADSTKVLGDKLTIPLEDAIRRLKAYGRPDTFSIVVIVACVVAEYVFIFHPTGSNGYAIGSTFLVFSVVLFKLIFKIKASRKLLPFYNQRPTPVLSFDSEKIMIPILLLPPFLLARLIEKGKESYTLKWGDIKNWTVSPDNEFYFLTLRKGTKWGDEPAFTHEITVGLNREFLVGKEQDILNFAQKFLATTIAPVPAFNPDKPWYAKPLDTIASYKTIGLKSN